MTLSHCHYPCIEIRPVVPFAFSIYCVTKPKIMGLLQEKLQAIVRTAPAAPTFDGLWLIPESAGGHTWSRLDDAMIPLMPFYEAHVFSTMMQ